MAVLVAAAMSAAHGPSERRTWLGLEAEQGVVDGLREAVALLEVHAEQATEGRDRGGAAPASGDHQRRARVADRHPRQVVGAEAVEVAAEPAGVPRRRGAGAGHPSGQVDEVAAVVEGVADTAHDGDVAVAVAAGES